MNGKYDDRLKDYVDVAARIAEFACACADRCPDNEHPLRPHKAIETVRRWARGEATCAVGGEADPAAMEDVLTTSLTTARFVAVAAGDNIQAELAWQADWLRAHYTPAPLEGEEENENH